MFRRVWMGRSQSYRSKEHCSCNLFNSDIAIDALQQCRIDSTVTPTFKLDTRSAVSNRFNWLIWSTIWVILGFVGAAAAASVDSHRRLLGVRAVGRYEVAMRREDGRTAPEKCLQLRAAVWMGRDMAIGRGARGKKLNIVGRERKRQLNRDASEKNDKSFGENLGVTCVAYVSRFGSTPYGMKTRHIMISVKRKERKGKEKRTRIAK